MSGGAHIEGEVFEGGCLCDEARYYASPHGFRRGFCPRCDGCICTVEELVSILIGGLDEPNRIAPVAMRP